MSQEGGRAPAEMAPERARFCKGRVTSGVRTEVMTFGSSGPQAPQWGHPWCFLEASLALGVPQRWHSSISLCSFQMVCCSQHHLWVPRHERQAGATEGQATLTTQAAFGVLRKRGLKEGIVRVKCTDYDKTALWWWQWGCWSPSSSQVPGSAERGVWSINIARSQGGGQ